MFDLQDRKLPQFRTSHSVLLYLCDSCTSKEKHNEQREEDTPRMYGMNDCR